MAALRLLRPLLTSRLSCQQTASGLCYAGPLPAADRTDFAELLDALLQRPEPPSELTMEQLDGLLGVRRQVAPLCPCLLQLHVGWLRQAPPLAQCWS